MTFQEYKDAVEYAREHNPNWRIGQSAFNVLMINRPDLSEQVRGRTIDPFHDGAVLPEFYDWVERNWERQPND